ncbi:acyloxyacyl hydrolase [Candidatus Berkiella aquae]|uniref:Lipid A deacylase n=1 Tax=Candidatus Berkiella aquae TaxID=295108 RepID=A0A0Q9YJW2_9GAMM|nr:acyloxyacyl hydrolase [Candidatus Berkiella aquae]MCS5710120.1 acyloxyacyl hydrolase [Candidatus Berkiella aquae]
MVLVIKKTMLAAVLLSTVSLSAMANLGIAFSSGQGIHDITPYRLALSWDFGPVWREDDLWGLNVAWENSFAIWSGPTRPELAPGRATDLNATTTGPMLRWQRRSPLTGMQVIPYTELGVGLSWLSETEIQGRVLSLHFQFEDKFGLGMRFGKKQQYDMAIRAYHYSNASIKRPNSGVNLAMASFGVWLPNK